MYHGAEHKSIHALERGEALTVENARTHTTLHPRCGTSFLLLVILIAILVFSVVFLFIPPITSIAVLNHVLFVFLRVVLLFPIAGLSYEVIRLAGKRPDSPFLRFIVWPGLMMQKITTREPTDDQIEIAVASLQTVLAAEQRYQASGEKEVEERQEEFESFAAYLRA